MSQRCQAITKSGLRCKNRQYGTLCPMHSPYARRRTPRVNYRAYINSPAWKMKRKRYIESPYTSNDCYGCGAKYRPGFNLHHLTYKRLGREEFDDLKMVCPSCHEAIHELAKRTKNIALATHKIRLAHKLPVKGPIRAKMLR